MPDEFVTSFQAYADWKRQSGIDIHITKFSDIGANSTDPAISSKTTLPMPITIGRFHLPMFCLLVIMVFYPRQQPTDMYPKTTLLKLTETIISRN